MSNQSPEWSDNRVAALKQRWSEGQSASQIAAELGTTRNAVLGKIHRLGLSNRVKIENDEAKLMRERRRQQANERLRVSQRKQRNQARAPEPPMLPEENVRELPDIKIVAEPLRIPFRDLEAFSRKKSNQCRYIADEPAAPDYIACGNPTASGESYCSGCKARVYYRPLTLTDDDRARRSSHGSRLWRPKTVAAVDISGEAA